MNYLTILFLILLLSGCAITSFGACGDRGVEEWRWGQPYKCLGDKLCGDNWVHPHYECEEGK